MIPSMILLELTKNGWRQGLEVCFWSGSGYKMTNNCFCMKSKEIQSFSSHSCRFRLILLPSPGEMASSSQRASFTVTKHRSQTHFTSSSFWNALIFLCFFNVYPTSFKVKKNAQDKHSTIWWICRINNLWLFVLLFFFKIFSSTWNNVDAQLELN